MRKKMTASTNNQRSQLVQANAWIKRESREIIKRIAKQERRSYAGHLAVIIDSYAECLKQPA
jgi:hypothetical protein